jgi:hypothetical protein
MLFLLVQLWWLAAKGNLKSISYFFILPFWNKGATSFSGHFRIYTCRKGMCPFKSWLEQVLFLHLSYKIRKTFEFWLDKHQLLTFLQETWKGREEITGLVISRAHFPSVVQCSVHMCYTNMLFKCGCFLSSLSWIQLIGHTHTDFMIQVWGFSLCALP